MSSTFVSDGPAGSSAHDLGPDSVGLKDAEDLIADLAQVL